LSSRYAEKRCQNAQNFRVGTLVTCPPAWLNTTHHVDESRPPWSRVAMMLAGAPGGEVETAAGRIVET